MWKKCCAKDDVRKTTIRGNGKYTFLHFHKIREDPTVTKLRFSSCENYFNHLLWMTWWMWTNMHKSWNTYMWEFKCGVPLLEVAKVHWLEDGCLSYWIWMASLEHICIGKLSELLKMVDYDNHSRLYMTFAKLKQNLTWLSHATYSCIISSITMPN